jgi:FkbM family methyltransferase
MKNKGVIQIGAHHAEEYEGWLSEGREEFIFFEPVTASYEKLCRILPRSEKISIYKLALGNMTGVTFMYIETEHQGKSCSILEPYLHLTQYPDIKFTGKEIVAIDKLDNIKYNRSLYDHLHIDTQGYEMEVLKGAVRSLKSIETIQCEVYRKELYKGCVMIEEITNWLYEQGFELVEVKWKGMSWGDANFQRS